MSILTIMGASFVITIAFMILFGIAVGLVNLYYYILEDIMNINRYDNFILGALFPAGVAMFVVFCAIFVITT